MAQELEITLNLRLQKSTEGVDFSKNITTQSFDWLGDTYASGMQIVGTGTHELLTANDITGTPVMVFVKNTEANVTPESYVEIGWDDSSTFRPYIRLQAQQWAIFPTGQASVYAQATNGDVKVEYIIIEEVD